MRFRCQTDPELTLLLHVVGSSSPLRWAQKTVRSTIDGTLKSYILICVRWYSLINILSRAYRISHSLFPCFFASLSDNRREFMCDCVAYLYTCVRVCVYMWNRFTWNLRMSRGFPAFFRQFWLHLRKNFRKNLKESTKQRQKLLIIKPLKAKVGKVGKLKWEVSDTATFDPFIQWVRNKCNVTLFQFEEMTIFIIPSKSRASVFLSSYRLTWVHGSFPTPICH